jgi:CHAD domain-containing protein
VAFRLRIDESVSAGLRRLAVKNLRAAGEELRRIAQTNEAIHNARKRVKKVRAIAHLVSKDHGRHLKRGRRQLRAVNRRLSAVRDAEVTLEIFDTLRAQAPTVVSEHSFARVRRMLIEHKNDLIRAARHERTFEKAAKDLRQLEKQSKRWRTRHDDFAAIARGMRTTHRRGRAAMARALESHLDDAFHEWRKEIKTLWYELRLLQASGAERIEKDIAALDAAEVRLGDDHNVTVLRSCLTHAAPALPQPDIAALHSAAARFQRELRRKAIVKARPIFRTPSKEYVRRIETAWHQANRSALSDSTQAPAA